MSIQYAAGTKVKADFFGDTLANLKNAINTNLVTAGWSSVVSGNGFKLTSGLTPQSLQCKVNVLDNGSVVTVQFMDTTEAKLGVTHQCSVAANKRYRIIANQFQFFLFVPSVSAAFNGAVMGGVPWIPAFLRSGTTTAIWSLGDHDGSLTFRNNLVPNAVKSTFITNANIGTGSGTGSLQAMSLLHVNTLYGNGAIWFNNCALIVEPLLAWGPSSAALPVIVGELWDAAIVEQQYQLDISATFDSHNWNNITDNNTAGSLFVVVP